MALTKTEVSELYVSIFGRASEGEGNTYWQNGSDAETVANQMLATDAANDYFGGTLSDEAFIEHIYLNTLNKTAADDQAGIDYWVGKLEDGESRGAVVAELVSAVKTYENSTDPVTKAAYDQFMNRVEVSDYTADTVEKAPSDYKTSLGFKCAANPTADLDVTNDPASVEAAKADIGAMDDIFTLTNGSDDATAHIFNADMVYTPDGSDRILSLQDEDNLTGTAGLTNELNVEIGNTNANEGTTAVVTPSLKNIQTLNIDWTGNTNTLDLRYSDSVDTINLNKITADATAVTLANITTDANTIQIQNVHDNTSTQTFDYVRGVLNGNDDTLNLTESNVLTNSQTFQVDGGVANEGFENVHMNVANGVDIRGAFSVSDMQNLTVSGQGNLNILNKTLAPTNDFYAFAPALANPFSIGQRTIDLSDFSGTSNLDISLNLGRKVDTANSGAEFYGKTTGGTGDDTFHTNVGVAATSATSHNIIDGGEGNNTLVSYAGAINGFAEVKNVQTLELRDQTGNTAYNAVIAAGGTVAAATAAGAAATIGAVDMDAFDTSLSSVYMRDEDLYNAATVFTLNNLTADQAASALTLAHATSTTAGVGLTGNQTVVANLKDATGTDDTVALTVVNGDNSGSTYNYTLNAANVENITVHDNDTESNTLTLTAIAQHTGTTTLDGGTAGLTYTVAGTLNSAVVDASAQASNLRLTVGDTTAPITTITQDIKLGTGDDVLTYANVDELDATDSLTDAGGNDTVRAGFSKDSTLDITGIENLDITATANVKLDMAKADVTNLVLLANSAVSGSADLSNVGTADINIAGGSLTGSVVTLDHSKLTELNFYGDADNDDLLGNTIGGVDNVVAHTFNGVTLANNTANNLTVNINTSLDINEAAATGGGAATYTIGQITTHGNTGMDIVVGNERINAGTTTTINNIYAKNMETLTASATGNLTLGTVSGAPLNNSLKTFDMSNVAGVVNANIISLGDSATVTLADANNIVSALGSAGKNVTMTAGNGNNTLTGTAQSDTITTGSGWDTINGDRGDNVITAGAGNDTVTAKDGNDTIDLGTGIDTYTDNLGTSISATTATNAVSMSGGIATVQIDVNGNGAIAAGEVNQMLAVGNGSDLTVSWLGGTMNATTAVLDGALATVTTSGAATTSTASSDLNIINASGGAVSTVTASGGNDVAIFAATTAAGDGLAFSGGAGNDAAVGTTNNDSFTGGTGADMFVMANIAAGDANQDVVVIADGDSTAAAWDKIFNFDDNGAAGSIAAAVGAATAGDDALNLDTTTLATAADSTALTTNITTASGTVVDDMAVSATGLVTFNDNSVVGIGGAAVVIGSAATQVSLSDALTAIATELNGTGKTVAFQYDANGDGVMTAADSTFVFQDGVNDTVVELVGNVSTGVEAVGGGTAGLIEIG